MRLKKFFGNKYKAGDNRSIHIKIMKTFNSLNAVFRRQRAAKQGIVKLRGQGIKDDPDSTIYPMFEVSNNHVTYYSVQRRVFV